MAAVENKTREYAEAKVQEVALKHVDDPEKKSKDYSKANIPEKGPGGEEDKRAKFRANGQRLSNIAKEASVAKAAAITIQRVARGNAARNEALKELERRIAVEYERLKRKKEQEN